MIGRYLKIFLPVITVIFLFAFGAFPAVKSVFASENPGSIKICKIVIDENGNFVDGSQIPGTTFSIDGLAQVFNSGEGPGGVLPNTSFGTPLTLNTDLIGNDNVNDAACVTYRNLAVGDYFYSQETINGSGNWQAPKYNDQFSVSVNSLSDFFNYDGRLFDADKSNDDLRDTNADGHIILQNERPNRTLIVLNQFKSTPPSEGGQSLSGASAPSCSANGPQVVDQVWFSDIKPGSVAVHWANKGDAFGYHIQYGPSANNLPWGTEVGGNVNVVTLNNLPSGDLWVTITAKQSADCGGPTTDPVKVAAGGVGGGQVLGASTLAKTGVFENLMLFAMGFGFLSLGLWQTQKALQKKSK